MTRKSRQPLDFYPTDLDVVRLGFYGLKRRLRELQLSFDPSFMVEPCSGAEAPFAKVALEVFPSLQAVATVEKSCDAIAFPKRHHSREDFFVWARDVQPKHGFQLACTNPPFSWGEEVARACCEVILSPDGLGMFLLRLAFLESKTRIPLWKASSLALLHVNILALRPSFTGDGHTDQKTPYGFYIFCVKGEVEHQRWLAAGCEKPTLDWLPAELPGSWKEG